MEQKQNALKKFYIKVASALRNFEQSNGRPNGTKFGADQLPSKGSEPEKQPQLVKTL